MYKDSAVYPSFIVVSRKTTDKVELRTKIVLHMGHYFLKRMTTTMAILTACYTDFFIKNLKK